jgi:uncharacterized protein YciI
MKKNINNAYFANTLLICSIGSAMNFGCGSSSKTTSAGLGSSLASSSEKMETAVTKPEAVVATPAAPAPKTLFTLSYVAGKNWKKGKPPQEQDLKTHFEYVGNLFKRGKLVTNGIYGDEIRGLYALAVANEAEAKAIAAEDPAVKNGVLSLDGVAQWMVMMDGFGATVDKDRSLFVLDYTGGSAWVANRSPMEQDLKGHFDYVGGKLADGTLLAAGHVPEINHGRYIIAASSKDQAEAFVAADPGVQSNVLKVLSVRPWMALQRQSIVAAEAAQRN